MLLNIPTAHSPTEWYGIQYASVFSDSSEANDLALRLAQQYTQHEDVIVLDQSVFCPNATN